jgi:hypothetical protein
VLLSVYLVSAKFQGAKRVVHECQGDDGLWCVRESPATVPEKARSETLRSASRIRRLATKTGTAIRMMSGQALTVLQRAFSRFIVLPTAPGTIGSDDFAIAKPPNGPAANRAVRFDD